MDQRGGADVGVRGGRAARLGPLLIGVAVSLILAVAASALAYRLLVHRDFTELAYDGVGRRVLVPGACAQAR